MIGYAAEFVLARHHSVMCFDFIAVTSWHTVGGQRVGVKWTAML